MKIKKFDYVEFLITEYKGKQIQKIALKLNF